MSYRCDKCGSQVPAGIPLMRHVQTRPKTYDDGTKGFETVKEPHLCHKCFGVEPPKDDAPRTTYHDPDPEGGQYTLVLANGKTLHTDSSAELACFWESNGVSIAPKPKRNKGGKSKGARNRGRQKVHRTAEQRIDEVFDAISKASLCTVVLALMEEGKL